MVATHLIPAMMSFILLQQAVSVASFVPLHTTKVPLYVPPSSLLPAYDYDDCTRTLSSTPFAFGFGVTIHGRAHSRSRRLLLRRDAKRTTKRSSTTTITTTTTTTTEATTAASGRSRARSRTTTPLPFCGSKIKRHISHLHRCSSADNRLSVLPNDNQFYDGYEEFIRNLQEDLENDSFDIYDNDDVIQETPLSSSSSSSSNGNESGGTRDKRLNNNNNNNKRRDFKNNPNNNSRRFNNNNNSNNYNNNRLPKYKRDINDDKSRPIDEEVITKLIIERSRAQKQRYYHKADSILHELNNVHGVYVWDKDRLWTSTPIAPSRRYNLKLKNNSNSNNNRRFSNRDDDYYHNNNNNNNNNNNINNNNQFGRNGHDYIQIGNGINSDICKLSLDEIHALLAKRLEYKLIRDFPKADEIQSELYGHGVRVHDKLKQWRGDGGIFADVEGMLSNKKFTMNEFSDSVRSILVSNGNEIENENDSDIDNHNGNDKGNNNFDDNDEELILLKNEIQQTVERWADAKKRTNYVEADSIRAELWDKYRVAVDGNSRTWSIGGDFGPNGTFRWTDDGPVNPRKDQQYNGNGNGSSNNTRDWRTIGMYKQSTKSEPLGSDDDEEEVWNLIHDRLEAKRVEDYDVADLILDHLYEEYRISVDDRLRQWSVGGEFDVDVNSDVDQDDKTGGMTTSSTSTRSSAPTSRVESPTAPDGRVESSFVRVYNRRGGAGHLSEQELMLVEAMVQRRSEEVARYNRRAAESIRVGLKKKFYVVVDDVNGEWHVRGNDYIMSPKLKNVPDNVEASRREIEALIRERSQAKGEGDFQRADEIRSDLFESFGITLDDRVKEWSVVQVEVEGEEEEEKDDYDNDDDEVLRNQLYSLTVPELKKKLKAASLPVSGKKAVLIERLMNDG